MAIFYDARLFWMSLIHQFKCCFRHEYLKNIVRIEGRKLIHRYYPYQLNRKFSWSYPLNDNIMPTLPMHLCFELVLFRYKCKDPMHGTSISYYSDVIMGAMALQITSLTIVYLSVYSGADRRKHRSSVTSLCQGNSPVTGELPIEMVSNAKNVPIWWGHNVSKVPQSSNCHWWWGLVAEWSTRKEIIVNSLRLAVLVFVAMLQWTKTQRIGILNHDSGLQYHSWNWRLIVLQFCLNEALHFFSLNLFPQTEIEMFGPFA